MNDKIELEGSLRYMIGYQGDKEVEQSNKKTAKFDSVFSNRVRGGVRGAYGDMEKVRPYVRPYVGIGCECELNGKVKGAIKDLGDDVEIPESSFGGVSVIGEVGASGKVWKFDIDISAQGYRGKREGIGWMLKKYAFGKQGCV